MNEMVTSGDIKKALANAHYGEFFMAEVKNGPTGTGMLKLDALAIYKSWSHQRMVGYEIKISRADFLQDGKMHLYLPYVHEFYVVCPAKMIDKKEIPDDMGLMWFNPDTGELKMKKKAAHRNITIDPDMMWYIMMYRLESDRYPFHDSRTDYIKGYIDFSRDKRSLGQRLRTVLSQKIDHLEMEVERLSRRGDDQKTVETLKAVMEKHGIKPQFDSDLVYELDKALSKGYPKDLDTLLASIQIAETTIQKLITGNGADATHEPSNPNAL